jgi:hypothetical protein
VVSGKVEIMSNNGWMNGLGRETRHCCSLLHAGKIFSISWVVMT